MRTDSASRVIRAPADAIYRALLDPDALVAWLPPANMTAHMHAFDARTGYRMSLTYKTGERGKSHDGSDVVNVEFVELVPGERIVQRVRFESPDPAFAQPMTMTWRMTPVPEGTEVTIVADDVPSNISKADHDAGMRSSLENLAGYVTG